MRLALSGRRVLPRKRKWALMAAVGLLAPMVIGGATARANLTGSTFEGNDGNLVVNTGGNTDWVSPAPHLTNTPDLPSGTTDNAFGQGTSENDVNVTVKDGSIPNSKADLGRFFTSWELLNGEVFLNLAWTRNNSGGTTNFDFEINQKAQPDLTTEGAKTLLRTPGDLLINYLFQGGNPTNVALNLRKWTGTAWSDPPVDLSGNSEGAVNGAQITDPIDGGNLATGFFGEASINLTKAGVFTAGACESFGSIYVKTRSSTSFSSEVKDFIAPTPVSINNCGTIVIKKVTIPSPDASNTSFPFTLTGGPSALNKSFSLVNGGSNTTSGVKQGSGYVATETVPAGWTLTSATCDDGSPVTNIDVAAGETVTCTFTNTAKATLTIKKVTSPNPDASDTSFGFTAQSPLSPATFSLKNQGTQDYTNILPATYSVAEDQPPNGWTITGHTCDNGDDPSLVTLAPGDHVTCTFTNTAHAALHVTKVADRNGVSFPFASNTLTPSSFSLQNNGTQDYNSLAVGNYDVHENTPNGWDLASATCDNGNDPSAITLGVGDNVTCTFTNHIQTGAVVVHKSAKQASAGGVVPEAGVTFTVTNATNGTNVDIVTGSDGVACVSGLPVSVLDGAYTIHETVPAGYAGTADQQFTVVKGDCASADASAAVFVNTPLTDITVSVNSQVDGATASTMHCVASDSTVVAAGATGVNGDGSVSATNLQPGTYTCTVVIDP